MAEPQWTPGPWEPTATPGGWDGVREPGGQLICSLNLNNPANMLLISAAPELYEALSKLAHEVAALCLIAEATIREAAGNTNYSVLWQRQAEATLALAKARGDRNG
jgi:hypothetical protein